MEDARKTFRDVQNKYKEMKKSDYSGDYSGLSVDLFPYMNDTKQAEERRAQGNEKPVVMVSFKEFKKEQEKLASGIKEAIDGSSLEQNEKDSKKSEVDRLLKQIIDTQKELMLAIYFMGEAFKGEYGGKVYTEETQGSFLANQFVEQQGVVQDGSSMYSEVQSNIKKMEELAAGLTPAESSAAQALASSDADAGLAATATLPPAPAPASQEPSVVSGDAASDAALAGAALTSSNDAALHDPAAADE